MKEERKIEVLKKIASLVFEFINDNEFDKFEKLMMLNSTHELLQEERMRMRWEIDESFLKPIADEFRRK